MLPRAIGAPHNKEQAYYRVCNIMKFIIAFLSLFVASSVVGASVDKVDLCHLNNGNGGVVISVGNPAWEAHKEHGDIEITNWRVSVDGEACEVLSLCDDGDKQTTQKLGTMARSSTLRNPPGTRTRLTMISNSATSRQTH